MANISRTSFSKIGFNLAPQKGFVKGVEGKIAKSLPHKSGRPSVSKKSIVGATIGRPQILLKQNLSPEGENMVICPSGNPKNCVFRRTSDARPYKLNRKTVFRQSEPAA